MHCTHNNRWRTHAHTHMHTHQSTTSKTESRITVMIAYSCIFASSVKCHGQRWIRPTVERTVTVARQRLSKLPTAAWYSKTAYQAASANTAAYSVFLSCKYTFCCILLTPSWCYSVKIGGGHEDLAGGHGPLCPLPFGYGPGWQFERRESNYFLQQTALLQM